MNLGTPQSLDCSTGITDDDNERGYIDIKCTAASFGKDGTAKGDVFKFKIGGITNPRTRNHLNLFNLLSLD